jgi:hypothetical protein
MKDHSAKETSAMRKSLPSARRRESTLAGCVAAALLLSGCEGAGDLVSYDLPAKSARYTFEADVDGGKTVWQYTSARATEQDAPKQTPCTGEVIGGDTTACRPQPSIFRQYDLGLALDNTAKAGQAHEITVTGYYQERLSAPPEVTSMKAEAGFDGSRNWRTVTTEAAGTNTFIARITHPKRNHAEQGVARRISATDSEGNTVKQTLPTAYKLR